MKNLLIIATLLWTFIGWSQDLECAFKFITQAEDAYKAGEFEKSYLLYDSAFVSSKGMVSSHDVYNAACSRALAGDHDTAFYYLEKIINTVHDPYSDYEFLEADKDFQSLKEHQQWSALVAKAKSNYTDSYKDLDYKLMEELAIIYQDDQELRLQKLDLIDDFGYGSIEVDQINKSITSKDSINVIKVIKILNEQGWLGQNIVGKEGNSTLFLVIQHASLETQIKYLPMLQQAVDSGNAEPQSLALLEDRIAIRQGKKQIYGSQIGYDQESKSYFVKPVQDPENINERRTLMGLMPIEEYVVMWDIVWNPLVVE